MRVLHASVNFVTRTTSLIATVHLLIILNSDWKCDRARLFPHTYLMHVVMIAVELKECFIIF